MWRDALAGVGWGLWIVLAEVSSAAWGFDMWWHSCGFVLGAGVVPGCLVVGRCMVWGLTMYGLVCNRHIGRRRHLVAFVALAFDNSPL